MSARIVLPDLCVSPGPFFMEKAPVRLKDQGDINTARLGEGARLDPSKPGPKLAPFHSHPLSRALELPLIPRRCGLFHLPIFGIVAPLPQARGRVRK